MNSSLKEKAHWIFVGATGVAGLLCLGYGAMGEYTDAHPGLLLARAKPHALLCCQLSVPLLFTAGLSFMRRYRMLFFISAFVVSQLLMAAFANVVLRASDLASRPFQLPLSMLLILALPVATLYIGWKFYGRCVDFYDATWPTKAKTRPATTQAGVAL